MLILLILWAALRLAFDEILLLPSHVGNRLNGSGGHSLRLCGCWWCCCVGGQVLRRLLLSLSALSLASLPPVSFASLGLLDWSRWEDRERSCGRSRLRNLGSRRSNSCLFALWCVWGWSMCRVWIGRSVCILRRLVCVCTTSRPGVGVVLRGVEQC